MNKRKSDFNTEQKNKKQKHEYDEAIWADLNNLPHHNTLISATKTKNYFLKDTLLDWLDNNYIDKEFNTDKNLQTTTRNTRLSTINNNKSKLSILCNMGYKFEDEVIKYFKDNHPNDILCLKSTNVEDTITAIKKGIPIIAQPYLINLKNSTCGFADLLVRSDYINRYFTHPPLTDQETTISSTLNKSFHYVVIDIKWTTMSLCTNGSLLRNTGRFYCYKGQLAIYTAALGFIQGYTPCKAYILAKSWKIDDKQSCYSCFDRLGVIDYNGFDRKYIIETKKAVEWYRNLQLNGYKWTCYPPTIPELYPNMCNTYDSPYTQIKKQLATQLNEITSIWMVNTANRSIAFENNIYDFKDDLCTSKTLGIKGPKISNIVDKILEINKSDLLISPTIITNNDNLWQTENENDYYIDIEFLNDIFTTSSINLHNSKPKTTIFMIGVVYRENNAMIYKSFILDDVKKESVLLQDFVDFISSRTKHPRFFHWGHIEETMLKKYSILILATWINMCKIFTSEPIIIKGAKKFNLKEITNAMYKNNMVDVSWSSCDINDGFEAMIEAGKYYYDLDNKDNGAIKKIEKYNEIDCRSIWSIVKYLRDNNNYKNESEC